MKYVLSIVVCAYYNCSNNVLRIICAFLAKCNCQLFDNNFVYIYLVSTKTFDTQIIGMKLYFKCYI